MKFAYARRFTALRNREKIVENICDEIIADAEYNLDKAEEAGLLGCNIELPEYPTVFTEDVRECLNGFFEMYGYHTEWIGKNMIHISYDGE